VGDLLFFPVPVPTPAELVKISSDRMFATAHEVGRRQWRDHGGIKPRSAPPRLDEEDFMRMENERRVRITLGRSILVIVMWVIILLSLYACAQEAFAKDHGFDKSDPTAQWFEGLKRPDDTLPKGSCCGPADAYGIEIVQDAIGDKGDEMGLARVTDGEPKTYPDGTIRLGLPNGTEFRFPKSKVNPLADGNPTKTAWAFFSVDTGDTGQPNNIRFIYCIIPLPPGT